jgi:hypothetical protein
VNLLDEITARGAEIRTQLRELVEQDEVYPCDLKSLWLVGSVDLALEHHEAIWCLQERRLTGAAFALLRPLIETMLRALWVNKRVITEAQAMRAWRDKRIFPKMDDMRGQISESYEHEGTFKKLGNAWSAMCSYTHSGGRQISRRFTGHEVKASYRDIEIAQALNSATLALLLLSGIFFNHIGCPWEAQQTLALLVDYKAKLKRRLRQQSVKN